MPAEGRKTAGGRISNRISDLQNKLNLGADMIRPSIGGGVPPWKKKQQEEEAEALKKQAEEDQEKSEARAN